jgi:hypothetical protein
LSNNDQKHPVDNNLRHVIMSVEEVAEFFRKSPSWVYKNWKKLGGRKLEGSLFFPSKEDLYERVFFKEKKAVQVRVHRERHQIHGDLAQTQDRSKRCGGQKKGGNQKPEATDDPNRHRLFDVG